MLSANRPVLYARRDQKELPMSWSGTMQCLIVNAIPGPITNLNVTHTLGDDSQSLPLTALDGFGTVLFPITVGSGHEDEWSVGFTTGGVTVEQTWQRCSIEEEDYQSASCVLFVLYDVDYGFSIIPPVSLPRLHNSYEGVTDSSGAKQSLDWSGAVECLIVNGTGGPITNLQVVHTIGDTTESPPVTAQENYGTLLYTISSSSTYIDEWSVSFTISSGVTLEQSGKQCNIEQEDYQATSCVIVMLANASVGFSIITPVSNPCLQNKYA
jgi:hypothetical protein